MTSIVDFQVSGFFRRHGIKNEKLENRLNFFYMISCVGNVLNVRFSIFFHIFMVEFFFRFSQLRHLKFERLKNSRATNIRLILLLSFHQTRSIKKIPTAKKKNLVNERIWKFSCVVNPSTSHVKAILVMSQ